MDNLSDIIEKRQKKLKSWILEVDPLCESEQKHLDSGTKEQVYWNYGYMVALKDVLALLSSASTSKN